MGTSRHDEKGDIQITEFMSIRVPKHETGAELFVLVMKRL